MLNFEVASSSSFQDIKKNHFVTAEEAAAADIDDSIMRNCIRVSLKKLRHTLQSNGMAMQFVAANEINSSRDSASQSARSSPIGGASKTLCH